MTALYLNARGLTKRKTKAYSAKHAQLAKEVRRDQPEARLQITIANALSHCLSPTAWFAHIPNGGKRHINEAKRLKAMGTRPGSPDLMFVYEGQAFFMELKAGRGKLSPAQEQCRLDLRRAGAMVETVRSLDEALDVLRMWGLPVRIVTPQPKKAA